MRSSKQLLLFVATVAQVVYGYVEYQPQQVHLSLGDNGRDFVVTWTTTSSTGDSLVEFGVDKFDQIANGTINKFTDFEVKIRTQEVHRVKLVNLQPNTLYKYRCGGKFGWSPIFHFKTLPAGDNWPLSLAVYGDMGNDNAKSLPFIQRETQDGDYHAILHIGDFAYDMHQENGKYADEFFRQIEPIAAYVPYMVCPGNHEATYNFSHYRNRFTMPGNNENLFYSFNIGPIHLISLSSEFYYYDNFYPDHKAIELQYNWLKKDLDEATKPENRQLRPWIIVMAHRPLYCSSKNTDDCTVHRTKIRIGVGKPLKYGLEEVFYHYGVDIGLWGHEHIYERFYPLNNYTVFNGSLSEPYRNPKAPIHITTGSAGCREGHENIKNKVPNYVAFRTDDYGYTKFKAFNSSHIYMEQISTNDSVEKVIDKYWIIKDHHEYFDKIK